MSQRLEQWITILFFATMFTGMLTVLLAVIVMLVGILLTGPCP